MPLEPPLCLQALFQYTSQNGNDYTTNLTIDESSYQAYSSLSGGSYVRSFYTGLNVAVGMYATSNLNGQVFRIKSITSQTAGLVVAVLEDVDGFNKLIDTGGRGNGVPELGTGYIFELNSDGIPALTAIRNPPPTVTFPDSIMGRFHYDNLKVDKTTLQETYCVAVGNGSTNYFATSPDGITWTGRGKGPFTTAVYNVAYNGSIWVAVGEGTNTIATSTNGITWTARTNPIPTIGRGIAWNGNVWVAVGDSPVSTSGKVATSPDGISWTDRTPSGMPNCNAVAWNGSLFVLGTSGSSTTTRIYTSPDGITWTSRTTPTGITNINTVAWGNNLWVAGGLADTNLPNPSRFTIITSPDGITWTGRGSNSIGPLLPAECRDVAYNGLTTWVAVGGDLYVSVVTSTDGTTWTPREDVFGNNVNPGAKGESITWNNELWVGVGLGTETIVTSQDGSNWITRQSNTGVFTGGRGYGVASRFGYPYALSEKRLVLTERGTALAPSIFENDTPATGIFFPAIHNLAISTAGNERLRINSLGNVGIGITNPTFTLDVNGIMQTRSLLFVANNGVTNNAIVQWTSDYGGSAAFDSYVRDTTTRANIVFRSINNTSTPAPILFLNGSNSRVGIGTTNPTRKFEVVEEGTGVQASTFLFAGANGAPSSTNRATSVYQVRGSGGSDVRGSIQFDLSSAANTYGFSILNSSDAPYIRFDGNSQRLGIGTTAPQNFLHIQKGNYSVPASPGTNGTSYGINFGSADYTDQAKVLCLDSTNAGGVWQGDLALYTSYNVAASSEKIRIKGIGFVGIGTSNPTDVLEVGYGNAVKPSGGSWAAPSDVRIKEDIQLANLEICYDNMKKLKLRYYRWKETYMPDWRHNDRHALGFIANEVEEVYPKAIKTYEKYTFSKNPNGDDKEQPDLILENFKTLDVDQIFKCNIGATQKLMEKVETLETENSTLKTRVSLLEQNLNALLTRLGFGDIPTETTPSSETQPVNVSETAEEETTQEVFVPQVI